MRHGNQIYLDWLIDCRDNRGWSWPRIALCVVHWVEQRGMTRAELLAKLKQDYEGAE